MHLKFSELISRFTLLDQGIPIFSLGIELIVVSTAGLEDTRTGYEKAYVSVLERFGSHIQLWRSNEMNYMEQIGPQNLKLLSIWLSDPASKHQDLYGVHLQSGVPEINPTPPIFDFFYYHINPQNPRSGIRVVFPVSDIGNDPNELVRFICNAISDIPLRYGFCGYALSWNPEYPDAADRFVDWALPRLKRYPGLSHGDFLPYVLHAGEGALAVSWLTFLGKEYTERLGGFERLAASATGKLSVQRSAHGGSMIRAGILPALGDVNRRDRLPEYRQVGLLVDPVRVSDDLIKKINLIVIQGDEKQDWLRRFFPEQKD